MVVISTLQMLMTAVSGTPSLNGCVRWPSALWSITLVCPFAARSVRPSCVCCSRQVEPDAVLHLLNNLYYRFDTLCLHLPGDCAALRGQSCREAATGRGIASDQGYPCGSRQFTYGTTRSGVLH